MTDPLKRRQKEEGSEQHPVTLPPTLFLSRRLLFNREASWLEFNPRALGPRASNAQHLFHGERVPRAHAPGGRPEPSFPLHLEPQSQPRSDDRTKWRFELLREHFRASLRACEGAAPRPASRPGK